MTIEQRVDELEKRFTKLQSQIERALEGVAREVQKNRNQIDAQNVQRKTNANDVNKVTQKAHDHISKLEKQVALLVKIQAKSGAVLDPKKQEKNLMKMVDGALAAYDKKKKR